jgi:hypothetical protein
MECSSVFLWQKTAKVVMWSNTRRRMDGTGCGTEKKRMFEDSLDQTRMRSATIGLLMISVSLAAIKLSAARIQEKPLPERCVVDVGCFFYIVIHCGVLISGCGVEQSIYCDSGVSE